ncbi:MAG: amino acid ABC transporter ATP-binding protein [Clostridia bacterium]|nr:amino acid ABC transporter ATP-binding protein [Clostridia bacterium]
MNQNPIEIKGLCKSFGSTQVLKDLDLTIKEHEVVAIIGGSGCGKTTLFRCIEMLETPNAGQIFIDGQEITAKGANIDKIRRSMGMVYQNFNLFTNMNVMDNLCLAPVRLLKMKRADAEKMANELLDQVGLHGRGNQMPKELSGGQRQRVAIARCLMMKPKIMLFDEPTSALDPSMIGEVLATMRMLTKRGMTMVIVTHEMKFAKEIANRVIFMADGGIYEDGTPKQIFENPQKEKTIAFIRNIKHFYYHIRNKNFDFIQLQGGIQYFVERYGLASKMAYRLQLCVEELIQDILSSKIDETVEIDITIEYSEADGGIILYCGYNGLAYNPFEKTEEQDNLGVIIIKHTAKSHQYSYENGRNLITIEM